MAARRDLCSFKRRIIRRARSDRAGRGGRVSCATNYRPNHVSSKISMKVTIIGGGGRVGSCAAFALQCGGLVAEIQLLDANQDLAQGEALDLLHGSAFAGDQ